MKILHHFGTNNLNNKNKWNDSEAHKPKFDNKFSLSSGTLMDPLPAVTFRLRGGKKNRATINDRLTWL